MLIPSERHSCDDLSRWRELERRDAIHASTSRFARHVARAEMWLDGFVREGDGAYAGVSWGKDSTVLADMVARVVPTIPLVWIRVEPIANPDCALVRDAFLSSHPAARYEEIVVWCRRDDRGWHATGTLESGFRQAADRFGRRHISGVRADESGARKRRMLRFGESSADTCAPIGWWRAEDVWAYLYDRRLPVHPAYACMGRLWDRDRIRVASLGGQRGTGHGRAEWERRYYGARLREIASMNAPVTP